VKPRVLAVIPARFASSRFEGKVLAKLAGKPIVQHVYERTSGCAAVDRTIVATDDSRVSEAVKGFGGEVMMTSPEHRNGTERIAEVASRVDAPVILNVQGDEPLINPDSLRICVLRLADDETVDVSTLATPIRDPAAFERPHVVKVVMDGSGRALYFSRAPIPHARGAAKQGPFKHIGVYCYRREYLLSLVKIEPGPLEAAECLEQLRVLENGGRIGVAVTPHDTVGVDLPEDLARAERHLASAGSAHE
jgi:3-deoxy-manno-octulosonate cytidylyltransferase (CMP-KDO synthetase)